METEIEQLRETQKKYGNILKLARSMATQFQCFISTQVKIIKIFFCSNNLLNIGTLIIRVTILYLQYLKTDVRKCKTRYIN